MTTLLWPALRARLMIAVVTLVLSAFATAAAVAGPLFGSVAQQHSRSAEVLAAPVMERTILASRSVSTTGAETKEPVPYLPGFQTIYGWIVPGQVENWPGTRLPFLVSRTGSCGHLSLASGRCPVADSEVIVREDTGLKPGSQITFNGIEIGDVRLVIVGVYRFLDASDPYWSMREELIGAQGGPIITTDRTAALATGEGPQIVDLLGSPAGFADLPTLKRELDVIQQRMLAGQYGVNTEMPELIERIERSDQLLATSLLTATVPLVLLSWLVLFLAVTGAVEQRRGELGLAALRGVPAWWRWLLPTLETAIPVLAGAVPGYFLGYLAVQLIAGEPVPGWEAAAYAGVAIGGALIAGGAAQISALTAPVLTLLRRTRTVAAGTGRQVAEIGALVLAAGAGVQAALLTTGQGGVGLLAPVGIALGLGLAGARLLTGPASRAGRWALRRGLMRTGLIFLSLARRPGTPAIVTLLTVVFGMFGFALAAGDVSERAREERARIELGADRVVRVDRTSVPLLMEAIRQTDPNGEFAMAAVEYSGSSEAPILAVDSSRLATVAVWHDETIAKALHPVAAKPLMLRGKEFVLTLDTELPAGALVVLNMRVLSGGVLKSLDPVELLPGRQTYRVPADVCQKECQLDELEVRFLTRQARLKMTIGEMTNESGEVLVPLAEMGDRARWLKPQTSKYLLDGGANGLVIEMPAGANEDARLYPQAIPAQVPMAGAGRVPQELTGHSGTVVYPVTTVATLKQVPRFGRTGTVMDIEYMDLGPAGGGEIARPEVWLNRKAPADVLGRLRAAGLTVLEDRTVAVRQGELRDQSPAQATRFLVLAAFGALVIAAGALLVVAVLERNRPEDGFVALRPQGLKTGTLGSVAAGLRWAALFVSALLGLIAAGISWWLARHVVPVFSDGSKLVGIPVLPDVSALLPVLGAAFGGLLVICWVAARVARAEGSSR
ncbi:FtsX-like permease family protein [Catelliglobosispora koreensis]|uniref:FtsX-like permease family protein n=1 Tax=Catelliglobosispora koreensis TaxID=129052 RepID=UPI00035ED9B5|nr:ABC transporter permease [Catelliglobosispora koreensis]